MREEYRNMVPQRLASGSFASDRPSPVSAVPLPQWDRATPSRAPAHCTGDELELHFLAPKLILATGEAAEPFLELSVGLDSFHIRMARLLAARGSDKLSSYTGEKGVGKGNTMQKKGSYLWQPCCLRPKTAIPPSSIPCPQNKSVRKICQRLLTLDKV